MQFNHWRIIFDSMWRLRNHVLLLVLTHLSISVDAGESYPVPPLRKNGSNQIQGTCLAEAAVGAFEHGLSRLGIQAKISTLYLHQYLNVDNDESVRLVKGVQISSESKELFRRLGPIVPEYMFPETHEGVSIFESALSFMSTPGKWVFPKIESIGAFHEEFNGEQIGFRSEFYGFQKGYRNSSNFEQLLTHVRNNVMITIDVHGSLFDYFDHFNGTMNELYNWNLFAKSEIDHELAVVGYDDSLQGIIVRNSWNSKALIDAISKRAGSLEDEHSGVKLSNFKIKFGHLDLPGYYLVPYQYFRDLDANAKSGYRILTANMESFANQYRLLSPKYRTIKALYTCDRDNLEFVLSYFKEQMNIMESLSSSESEKEVARKSIGQMIAKQTKKDSRFLNHALLPRQQGDSKDLVKDFYNGALAGYYCGRYQNPGDSKKNFWPVIGRDADVSDGKFLEYVDKLTDNDSDILLWIDFLSYLSGRNQND